MLVDRYVYIYKYICVFNACRIYNKLFITWNTQENNCHLYINMQISVLCAHIRLAGKQKIFFYIYSFYFVFSSGFSVAFRRHRHTYAAEHMICARFAPIYLKVGGLPIISTHSHICECLFSLVQKCKHLFAQNKWILYIAIWNIL